MLDIDLDYKTVIAAALVGAAAVYAVKKGIEALPEAVEAAAPYVDPTKETNLAFRFQDYLYKAITGSNETLGADVYDGVQNVKNWWSEIFTFDDEIGNEGDVLSDYAMDF